MPDNAENGRATSGADIVRGFYGSLAEDTNDTTSQTTLGEETQEQPDEELLEVDDQEASEATADELEEVVDEEVEKEEEPEDTQWFFEGDTSRYRTADDAKRGIQQKDAYIRQLREELDTLAQHKEIAEMYTKFLPEEEFKRIALSQYLPEEFRGVNEDDIEDEETLRRYLRARMEAEFKVESEMERIKKEAEDAQNEYSKRIEEATNFLAETVNPSFFEVSNPEDRFAVGKMLEERRGDYSPLEVAQYLAANFDKEYAMTFLRGLKSDFWSDRKTIVAQKIEKEIKPKLRPKKVAAAAVETQPVKRTPKQRIQFAYQNNHRKDR